MGLDMHLKQKKAVYGSTEWRDGDNNAAKLREIATAVGLVDFKNIGAMAIEVEAAYWRKSNQIHKWFVDNVQNGEDDCKEYEVTAEQLLTLRDLCQRVIDASELIDAPVQNGQRSAVGPKGKIIWEPIIEPGKVIRNPGVANELLPCEGGFFFGSTDYNEWYLHDLTETVTMLDALPLRDDAGEPSWKFEYTYRSSW